MAPVKDITREDLIARREEILERLGTSSEEFADTSSTKALSFEEWAAKDELETIAFLLAEDN
jgi:hypothetical protein